MPDVSTIEFAHYLSKSLQQHRGMGETGWPENLLSATFSLAVFLHIDAQN